MSTAPIKVPSEAAATGTTRGMPTEVSKKAVPKSARQDLIFAVKLFGIAGLVVFAIWLMNRVVS